MNFKINNLNVRKKFNLGNYEMLELGIDASPEDNELIDWELMTQKLLTKMINVLDKTEKERNYIKTKVNK